MPKSNRNTPELWRSVGVLRGRLKADEPTQGKNPRVWLNYRGRNYPVLPSNSRFEHSKRFDLSVERSYLVYPQPRTYNAFSLIKRDYGYARSQALQSAGKEVARLYRIDPWSREFLHRTPAMLKQENFDRLLEVGTPIEEKELRACAHSMFLLAQELLDEENTEPNKEAKEVGSTLLSFLNGAICDQLYHPGTRKEERAASFRTNWRRSRKFSKEVGISPHKKMFYSLSFVLVAYSEDEDSFKDDNGRVIQDGEFLLSGKWTPWKLEANSRRYITFSSHLNKEVERNYLRTSLQSCHIPKRLIVSREGEANRITRECNGKAIADFNPFDNTFRVKHFEPLGAMAEPLSAKELTAMQRVQSSQLKGRKKVVD